jgi:hypothetical protein
LVDGWIDHESSFVVVGKLMIIFILFEWQWLNDQKNEELGVKMKKIIVSN